MGTSDPTDSASGTACPELRFERPTPVPVLGYEGDVMEPFLAPDGDTLFFNDSNAPGRNTELHWARRSGSAFRHQGPLEGVSTEALEAVPSLDVDHRFYFVSTRSYDHTASSLYRGRYAAGRVTQIELVPGVSREQPLRVNFDAEVSRDGNALAFVDGVFDPILRRIGSSRLVMAVRSQGGFVRVDEDPFVRIHSDALEFAPALSPDLLTLYFTRVPADRSSPPQIYVSTRPSVQQPFCPPTRILNLGEYVEAVTLGPSGQEIFFHRRTPEGFRLFRSRRLLERTGSSDRGKD